MKFKYTPENDKRSKKWEYKYEAKEMLKFINEDDVIYDIGSNIGDHSVFFGIKRPNAEIFAFEPIKKYYDMAIKNIKHFNVKNVKTMNVGIGSKLGELEIDINNEGSSFVTNKSSVKKAKVKIETIDNLVKNKKIKPPNFVKIDVEGFAEEVFIGMLETLKKYNPTIIMEPHPIFLNIEQLRSKFKVLEKIGYGIESTLLNEKSEFVLKQGAKLKFEDFESSLGKEITRCKIKRLRSNYDSSYKKEELENLKRKYSDIKKSEKISFPSLLIWSKLYRLFTFKWIKTK